MKTQNVVDSCLVDEIFYKINEIYMHHATFIAFLARAMHDSTTTIGDVINRNVRTHAQYCSRPRLAARSDPVIITFGVGRRRREMCCGHARLCVCLSLSVRGCMPTLLHGPGCNLGSGRGAPSCALLGGFAIGAGVTLLWHHHMNAKY